jgi:hypothetical protein
MARRVRAIHFRSEKKLNRPHKMGDDDHTNNFLLLAKLVLVAEGNILRPVRQWPVTPISRMPRISPVRLSSIFHKAIG